ncbi:MAG: tryptophan synthase subunit beta [Dehalococcoidia bacterium]|nr:tryptophan synthase subunit beta [Dehalococcoidia bacterium]MDP6782586.1 tryptophan synthase subunit beta [Dehalococcoidia bacterium]
MDTRNRRGYFGEFGGRFVPETLVPALEELERAYEHIKGDPAFWEEFNALGRDYIGRPTPLYHARRLSEYIGGAQVLLKREDLCHTGAHKINNALGQGLLARRMGKQRVVAETGAGQHGVATAAACALLDLECVVFMGSVDMERQSPNVRRMRLLGAEVRPVEAGSATLKEAISEALRDWVTHVADTYYLLGSVVGPHPYPTLVRDFQAVIGREAREQVMSAYGRLPDRIVACVGGGSNAMGIFYPFLDAPVPLIGVEAAGKGLDADTHSATLVKGRPGVLHGTRSYLLQDAHGQIEPTHSIAPGLDYPGVGPEHSFLRNTGRVQYVAVDDAGALESFRLLSRLEGILPALEPSHATFHAMSLAREMPKEGLVLVNLSGRGDKDIGIVAEALGL